METLEYLHSLAKEGYYFLDNHRAVVACSVGVCGFLVFRRWMQGGVCRSKKRLDGKTVLVTGANAGIGKETARDLARRGARVILACRDVLRAETAADDIRRSTGNNNVVVYKLDLASIKSIRQCAEEVKAKEKRLDVLINNAGILWTPPWKTEDGFEMQFGTNHLGHFLLTNLLLDLLKSSAPSRIVNVSSLAHGFTHINFDDVNMEKSYDPFAAYNQSKLANVLFTRELARRLKGTQVTAYSLHPGGIQTDIIKHAELLKPEQKPLFMKLPFWFLLLITKPLSKSVQQGAQTTVYCAVSEDLEGVSGKYYSDCAEKTPAPQAQDDEAAARLWKLSEEMVGLK